MDREQSWRKANVAAGLWCIAVGIAVITLWLSEPARLAAQYPFLFGMKFNSALAVIAIGAALLMMAGGLRHLPALMMAPVFVFGAVALAQHLFGIDAGIDTALHTPFTDIRTSLPGRIAPNTAACYMMVSAALFLRAYRRKSDPVQIVLGLATFIIAAAAFIGYAIALDFAHDWVRLSRMSFQSTTCFVALGIVIVFTDTEASGFHRATLAGILGLATYLVLLVMTYYELARHEAAFGITFTSSGNNARSTLSSLVLVSGALSGGLLVHLYLSSRRARRMAADLAESQARLSAIIDNAVDGIITIDERGVILTANAACTRIFGYLPGEMIGNNVKMLMPEPYHGGHDRYLSNYQRGGPAKVIGIGREVEGQRKDGAVFPLDLAVAKVEVNGATIYSGLVRDISERKANEQALIEANAELEEFAYRTSHDLRSPIASSMGLLGISREMLAEGDHAALGPMLQRMEQNFRRLDHLIQNIITLTRNRLMEEEERPVALRALVSEAIDALSHLDDVKRIRIENHVPAELTIISKPSKFQVIVGNLLSNAVKYHDPREAEPAIDVRAFRYHGKLRLSVEDNGLGVPPASRHLLFRMFKRLHPNRSFGSGLGLYILKKSAESLGGDALYEARDKGSRFIIELPDRDKHENHLDPGRR
ncbi:sensor histidine kinase [Shinella zoogloeoides]|uniref:Sensor protein FixL n=1 Tax=Shinella zoogloeoides TaxID=352475 RepID=A0A6N8TA67_SHIZO|nr:PAS domain-containing sensor histidine kinase [Shinella zoogloeoides]MXO00173.1 PAS domain S-box protein [Shinella zoogloeoides]UEX82502.1 PAS domain-containing sensor histidine kinase [Shinella zoogloeoides]